jgi:hypothetical protein
MVSKKTNPPATLTDLPALRIGSRVRCTDDGVTGRIVWANAVSVKITWDDGEQVTWRRDSLATRPLEILDPQGAGDDGLPVEPPAAAPACEPMAPEQAAPAERPAAVVQESSTAAEQATTTVASVAGPLPPVPEQEEATLPTVGSSGGEPAPAAKPKRQRQATAGTKEKKLSALDAAEKVLKEAGQPMGCQELIGAMAAEGYWSSPSGKTPDATLYSAIVREITTKGEASRFRKAGPGRFALNCGA